MTEDTKKILDEIRPELQRVLPKGARVLLFGSRARGDNRPDSDFDLLVLLDHEGRATASDTMDTSYDVSEILWERNLTTNVIVNTGDEWEMKQGKSLFYYNVMDEAKQIWG